MRSLREALARLGPARADELLAAVIAILIVAEAVSADGIDSTRGTLTALAGVLLAAPVALRRRRPGAALVTAAAVAAVQAAAGGELGQTGGVGVLLALAVLAYSAGAWLTLRPSLVALALSTGLFGAFVAQTEGDVASAIAPTLVVLAVPWVLGRLVRERTRRAGAFRELALQTEREQAERERAAIAHERLRIGVELQDIVAHSVSAMVIAAAGARQLMPSDPDRARESIFTVEQTGRQTLADMRRLLGVLRRDEDPRALAPQPGLAQLGSLLAAVAGRGVHCELRTRGEPSGVTPGMDLVGYRVVEAALACAAGHGAGHAQVELGFERDVLALDVSGSCDAPGAGAELQAIRERVALYGGSFTLAGEHEPFAVRVRLPLAGVPAA